MKFLILSDMFSLESWLIDDQSPKIMPAVYNFFIQLDESKAHSFDAIIYHKSVEKTVTFPNGSKIYIKKLNIPFHYLRKAVSFRRMLHDGQSMIDTGQYELVYGLTIYSVAAGILGRRNSMLSVSRIFGSLIWDAMQKGEHWKLYTRFVFQYCEAKYPSDIIICTEDGTNFDSALAKINPSKRAHMLYNGIDSELKQKLMSLRKVDTFDTAKVKLISIGRLTYWKRHDLAIEVLEHLVRYHGCTEAQLTILGSGEERVKLQQIINEKGLKRHINIKDPIPHHDLPELLAQYDAGIFMYDASNLGNALWETCLSGRLICTRPTGKTASIFRDGDNALMSHQPAVIAQQLVSLTPKRIATLTVNSRQTINDLLPNWTERINQELDIIRSALDC